MYLYLVPHHGFKKIGHYGGENALKKQFLYLKKFYFKKLCEIYIKRTLNNAISIKFRTFHI